VLALGLGALVTPAPARAWRGDPPVEHEPIPPDPREDLAMGVVLAGEMPGAIRTPAGVVAAPDPLRNPAGNEGVYDASESPTFKPDRDTERPDLSAYDEPFTPSTAPFKRLQAFDSVDSDYTVRVYDARLVRVQVGGALGHEPEETEFFADLVVDLAPDRNVLIPSVGPGARIVRAHLGSGATDIPYRIVRDGADNWFLQPTLLRAPVRARLVMQLAIAKAAFGGPLADAAWSDLPLVPPFPARVVREAAHVRQVIGVSRAMRPRDAVARLVQYFRGFADADDPPTGRASIYLDLALSKKGVCRHRAFAFLVTAQSLGIPTRLVENEVHAWVEVHDGARWTRIDLGGAGRVTNPALFASTDRPAYQPPADAYPWPQGATDRGQDFTAGARPPSSSGSATATGAASHTGANGAATAATTPSSTPATLPPAPSATGAEPRARPAATVTVTVTERDVHRGYPLRVAGTVQADGEPCAHTAVELWLRRAQDASAAKGPSGSIARPGDDWLRFGTAATGDDGAFAGGGVVPASASLGDYDVVATAPGDARCGPGRSVP
jgi:hypothetical protein